MDRKQFSFMDSIPNNKPRARQYKGINNHSQKKKSTDPNIVTKQLSHLCLEESTSDKPASQSQKKTRERITHDKSKKKNRSLSYDKYKSNSIISLNEMGIRRNSTFEEPNLKNQCSSLRSSVSSVLSIEDSYDEKKKGKQRNPYHNRYNHKFNDKHMIYFSNDFMKRLINNNDELLIKTLLKNKEGFKNLFCSHKPVKDMTVIFQLLSRINKLSDTISKEYFVLFSLNPIFTENTSNYISCILLDFSNEQSLKKLKELIQFYFESVHIIPSENLEDYYELFQNCLSKIEKIKDLPDIIINNMKQLLSTISEKIECEKIKLGIAEVNILPTHQDLTENPELQPNIVIGSYDSASKYLKLHFKLLKEDFVCGLRSGLNEYEESMKEKNVRRFKDIFIYDAVYCGLTSTNRKNNFSLTFEIDNKKLKKVDWSTTKRLMHGSLLLVSNDHFKTFYYAFVENYECPKTEAKTFIISASVVDTLIKFQKYSECTIMEPKVFFHPYYQVLKTLKNMDPNMFPMERYIVQVNTNVNPPEYVTKESSYTINGNEIRVYDIEHFETLCLNKTQISALQAALTKEYVLIQGPPGTGKSYLGLRIINVLLENKPKWSDEESPILIICYRNNAVDQILESLINDKRKVVRLGSQSSNKVVKDSCLRSAIRDINTNSVLRDQINMKKNQIETLKSKISQLMSFTDCIRSRKIIISLDTISQVLTDRQKQFFGISNAYEEWLLGGYHENDNLRTNEMLFEDFMYENNINFLKLRQLEGLILLNIYDLKDEIFHLRNKIDQNYDGKKMSHDILSFIVELLQHHENKIVFLKKIVNRMNLESNEFIDPSCLDTADLSELSIPDRWKLYHHWAGKFCQQADEKIEELVVNINENVGALEELFELSDGLKICELRPDVVGATTTGAARLHNLLMVVKPKIVIFEEAAEVLEAHTVATLSKFCKHVIMIGDHQQLKPSPANHLSVVKYKLDVSLFERMINNEMEYFSLNEQHRMRPLISSLVIPQFYPSLKNHSSVENYPDVRGLRYNMFFVDHIIPEDEMIDNDSHRNKHEASFILALADYLLKQGYEEKEITILTFYGAQLIYLKALKPKYKALKNVSVEVVDNFQGEENKIILLSLVRSNPHTIGFLSKMNRICVALTRAREGFYLVGNMTTLKGNSSVWKGINETLKKNQVIGNELPLKCTTHGTLTFVQHSEEFAPIIYGGCTLKCGVTLDCGHVCDLQCHSIDDSHLGAFSCRKPCERKKNCEIHDCDAPCGIPCPKCEMKVEISLPCGHMGLKICAGDFLPCDSNCSEPLPCGHPCSKECHFPVSHSNEVCKYPCGLLNKNCPSGHTCEKPCGEECGECEIKTLVNLPCGHIAHGKCNAIHEVKCKVLTEKELECGHMVKGKCSLPINEIKCTEHKLKLLTCGHKAKVPCYGEATHQVCKKTVNKELSCGHKKTVLCFLSNEENIFCDELVQKELNCEHQFKMDKCSTPPNKVLCEEKVVKTAKCGHKVEIMCHLSSETVLCDQPCHLKRPCGHKCSGLCGMLCPECTEPVKIRQVCGHFGIFPCSEYEESSSCSGNNFGSPKCQTLCKLILKCGHQCEGSCGICMQGRVHKACLATCGKPLLCGHKCSTICNQGLHVCNQNCINTCKHQRCNNKCSDPCKKCRKPCEWRCKHLECTRLCWEECNRSPCDAPCQELLECGHPCCGLCGEPCPPICLTCSPEKYLDARYVLLEDCGHVISQNEIHILLTSSLGLFLCPLCKKPQTKTNYIRYHSKKWFVLLSKVKGAVVKKYNNVTALKHDFNALLKRLQKFLKLKLDGFEELKLILEEIVNQTGRFILNKKDWIDIENLRSLIFKSYYICEAFHLLEERNLTSDPYLLSRINHLASYLRRQDQDSDISRRVISHAEMYQFKDELSRISVLSDLIKIKDRTIIKLDPDKKQCFDEAWKAVSAVKEFDEVAKKDVSLHMHQLDSSFQINLSLMQSKFLSIFEKYYELTLHKQNWIKCKKSGHVFYKIEKNTAQVDCPTCANNKLNFFL